MANYPTSDPSFTSKSAGQTIEPSHINSVQDEVVAIGAALRGTLQHGLSVATGGLTVSTGGARIAGPSTFTGEVTNAAQPRCMAYSSVGLSLPADTYTPVPFAAQDFAVGSIHSTGTNPSRITVPAGSSGVWMLGAVLFWSTGGSPNRAHMRLIKNSTTEVGCVTTVLRSSVAALTTELHQPVSADGGDYFEIEARPDTSTGSLAASGAVRRTASQFWAAKLW